MFVSSGNEVRTWKADTNELVDEFLTHSPTLGTIQSFAIRPDNEQLGCVFDSGCIKFLNLDSGFQEDILDVSEPKACCFDSSGRQFAVGTMNSYIEIFDSKSQSMKKKLWKINPPSGCVNCITWNKTDRYLATGHPNGSINLFNSVMCTFLKPLIHPKYNDIKSPSVLSLQWSFKNPPQLVSGYDDGSVILWDTNKLQPVSLVKAHNSPCTTVLSGLGASLLMISSCLEGILNFHDCTSNKTVSTIQCRSSVTSCDLSSNGYNMCVGTIGGYVQIYDIRHSNQSLSSFKAHDTAVHCIKYFQKLPPKSNNSSIYSQISQIEGQSLIKKSNSFTHELGQGVNILNPNSLTNPMSIYSPENQRITHKLRAQSSSGNLVNQVDSDVGSKKPLSSTTNSTGLCSSSANFNLQNTPNNLTKQLDYSKISKERGDLYSPLVNGSSLNEEITLNGSKNHTSPYQVNLTAPKLSSTKLNQFTTPKLQSSIKINVSSSSGGTQIEKMMIDSPVKPVDTEIEPEATVQVNPDNIPSNNSNGLSLPLDMIREMINDAVDNLRYEMMSENFKFKAEMIREFMDIRKCIEESFRAASVNDALVSEIERLREENKRLKKLY